MSEQVKELLRLMLPYGPGPSDDGDHVVIKARSEFEPNGRASESWEFFYELTLPKMRHHWKNTLGEYVEGNAGVLFKVKRRTLEECIAHAKDFLTSQHVTQEEHQRRVDTGYYKTEASK